MPDGERPPADTAERTQLEQAAREWWALAAEQPTDRLTRLYNEYGNATAESQVRLASLATQLQKAHDWRQREQHAASVAEEHREEAEARISELEGQLEQAEQEREQLQRVVDVEFPVTGEGPVRRLAQRVKAAEQEAARLRERLDRLTVLILDTAAMIRRVNDHKEGSREWERAIDALDGHHRVLRSALTDDQPGGESE